jgi:hypothetical protein
MQKWLIESALEDLRACLQYIKEDQDELESADIGYKNWHWELDIFKREPELEAYEPEAYLSLWPTDGYPIEIPIQMKTVKQLFRQFVFKPREDGHSYIAVKERE